MPSSIQASRLFSITVRVILAILILIPAPAVSQDLLFALLGTNPTPIIFLVIGYLMIPILVIASIWNPKFIIVIPICILIITISYYQNTDYWKQGKQSLCAELRTNNTCVWDGHGSISCKAINDKIGGFFPGFAKRCPGISS
jgi:hypothetical protein